MLKESAHGTCESGELPQRNSCYRAATAFIVEFQAQSHGRNLATSPSHQWLCGLPIGSYSKGTWQELMKDPVAAADGTVYERAAIEEWFLNPKGGLRSRP